MATSPTSGDFEKLYIDDLNLGDKVSRTLEPLHAKCLHRGDCWKNFSTAHYPPKGKAEIYHPYIGKNYQELKLLCLGINMNNYGGFDACNNLVKKARDEMENGAIKVRFGNDYKEYPGTYLYHRMGVYSKIIAEEFGKSKLLTHIPSTHIEAFDFIAYTNHVKCSPKNGKRSKPCWEMWNNCGDFILKEELKMLLPNILLVFGKSDNWWWLKEKVFDSSSVKTIDTIGKIRLAEANVNKQILKVIVMPHPSYYSYTEEKGKAELQTILSKNPSFL